MKTLSVEHAVYRFAGFMILLSVALSQWLHPGFYWLTLFVGANLLQYSFTKFCPVAVVFQTLGLKTERELGQEKSVA